MRLPPEEQESGLPNLTPIVDVVFLLLIFFLVATRFDEEEREIPTRLAQVAKAQPLSKPPGEVVVNITKKGEYVVIGETLDEPMLASFLHQLALGNQSRQTIQIRADQDVSFKFPARVMGLCEDERISHYCTVLEEH